MLGAELGRIETLPILSPRRFWLPWLVLALLVVVSLVLYFTRPRPINSPTPPVTPAVPVPLGESLARFEYVLNDEKKRGECQLFTLAVGDSGVALEFVRVPAGKFLMGSPNEERDADRSEHPRHEVTISKDFYLGRYEVTQEQYHAVTGKSPSEKKGAKRPVEMVSWNDAMSFCELVSTQTGRRVSLPTEAEWEYACRAGTLTPFSFGTKLNGDWANCDGQQPYGTKDAGPLLGATVGATVAVGSYPANAWGLHDMHGNVYEWVRDPTGAEYTTDPRTDPLHTNPTDPHRVLRGGSWYEPAKHIRAARRHYWTAKDATGNQNGFRVALYP